VIAEQDVPFCVIGAESAYRVQHEIFDELDGADHACLTRRRPDAYNERLTSRPPNTEKIIAAVKDLLGNLVTSHHA